MKEKTIQELLRYLKTTYGYNNAEIGEAVGLGKDMAAKYLGGYEGDEKSQAKIRQAFRLHEIRMEQKLKTGFPDVQAGEDLSKRVALLEQSLIKIQQAIIDLQKSVKP